MIHKGKLCQADAWSIDAPLDASDVILGFHKPEDSSEFNSLDRGLLHLTDGHAGLLVRGFAALAIKKVIVERIKNDGLLLWNGGVSIAHLVVNHVLPALYCDSNHPDVLQAYAKSAVHPFDFEPVFDGLFVGYADVTIDCHGDKRDRKNGFLFTEICQYLNIVLFPNGLDFVSNSSAPYFLDMTNATNLSVGSERHPIDPDRVSNKGIRIGARGAKSAAPACENIVIHAYRGLNIVLEGSAKSAATIQWYDKEELPVGDVAVFPQNDEVSVMSNDAAPKQVFSSLSEYASARSIDLCVLEAIEQVESKGIGFYKKRVSKLWERHIYDRQLREHGFDPAVVIATEPSMQDIIGYRPYVKYGRYAKQQSRFDLAAGFHLDSAIEGCSWGAHQVLGCNWKMCGFASAQDFREAMQTREGQLRAFIGYLDGCHGLVEALQARDWRRIKVLYNGPKSYDRDNDGEDDYIASLKSEYTKAVMRKGPRKKLLKSRTIVNNSVGALTKGIGGTVLIAQAESLTGMVASLVRSGGDAANVVAEGVESGRDAAGRIVESVAKVGDQLVFAEDAASTMNYLPYIIGGVLLLGLIPHARVMWAYLDDHGYVVGRNGLIASVLTAFRASRNVSDGA